VIEMARIRRRTFPLVIAAAAAVTLAGPAAAQAVTRFAAPGGTAPDTACTHPSMPCSIGAAAGGPDVTAADEAVILPGRYSESDLTGDADQPMDHTAHITAGNVHGESSSDRPVIAAQDDLNFGAFVVDTGTTLSDVEIDTTDSTRDISVFGGVVDGLIARTSRDGSTACAVVPDSVALLRNSLCFSDGGDASAIAGSLFTSPPGTRTVRLRNVTAVATGPDSDGLFFQARGFAVNMDVDAKSIIARGGAHDVFAAGLSNFDPPLPNTGGHTSIVLDHSNYATTQTNTDTGGGSAMITTAGSGTNQTKAPTLAPDGLHELAGSPTVDAGAVDGSGDAADIDGQRRAIGGAPDIGADELGLPTSTEVSCSPNPLQMIDAQAQCAVTVTDTSTPPPLTATFLSGIRFSSDSPGSFGADCEVLNVANPLQGVCTNPYKPAGAGVQTITATYPGDEIHDPSQGTTQLDVPQPAVGGPGATGTPPHRKCAKKHRRGSKKKKTKCRRKRR
jgi:hypothetical protein